MTLIEKLEAGPGSRELSDECLLAVGCEPIYTTEGVVGICSGWRAPDGEIWIGDTRPNVTENVQDTISHMVPEGCLWLIGSTGLADGYKPFRGDVWGKRLKASGCIGNAHSPALALSAASLKAHAAVKEKTDAN